MSEEVIDMDILLKLKATAEESYNGQAIPPYELSLFAERMDNGEMSKRFYDAETNNANQGESTRGRILSTDDKLIFIGNPDGERVGAVIKYNDVIGVEIEVNDKNKALANFIVIVNQNGMGLEYQFEMSRFGLESLADYIMEMGIPY